VSLNAHFREDTMSRQQKPQRPVHEILLTLVMVIMVGGFLALAIMDSSYREPFAELVKVAIAAYVGWMMPK
jgi:hypothetical protein